MKALCWKLVSALITPYGGAPITLFQIQLALQEKGVVSGIIKNEIETEGYAVERIIAKGLHPVRNIDARFQSLMPQIGERKYQVNERGIADYWDLWQLYCRKVWRSTDVPPTAH